MSQQVGPTQSINHMRAYCQTQGIDTAGREQAEIEALYWRAMYTRLADEVRRTDAARQTHDPALTSTASANEAEHCLTPGLITSWTRDQIC